MLWINERQYSRADQDTATIVWSPGRTFMNTDVQESGVKVMAQEQQTDEVVQLIRKLRWIGLESEAKELQDVLEGFSSSRRGTLVAGPHSTD